MSGPTHLQGKIGGSARTLDQAAFVADAQRNIEALTPQIEAELNRLRFELRPARSVADMDALFVTTHQIRGLAGSIGRPSLGALADALACYITDCSDAGAVCSHAVTDVLAGAVDRAFDLEEGDELLAEAILASRRLINACSPKALSE